MINLCNPSKFIFLYIPWKLWKLFFKILISKNVNKNIHFTPKKNFKKSYFLTHLSKFYRLAGQFKYDVKTVECISFILKKISLFTKKKKVTVLLKLCSFTVISFVNQNSRRVIIQKSEWTVFFMEIKVFMSNWEEKKERFSCQRKTKLINVGHVADR